MTARITAILEQKQPIASRLVRVHQGLLVAVVARERRYWQDRQSAGDERGCSGLRFFLPERSDLGKARSSCYGKEKEGRMALLLVLFEWLYWFISA